jgi:hypothetical protein
VAGELQVIGTKRRHDACAGRLVAWLPSQDAHHAAGLWHEMCSGNVQVRCAAAPAPFVNALQPKPCFQNLFAASHLRSAASTVRGMRALGELSTANAGSAAVSCPASSAAHACTAASAPADTWFTAGQTSSCCCCCCCCCCLWLLACVVVLQVLRQFLLGPNGAKVDRFEWCLLLLSCCPAGDSSMLVMLADHS